MRKKLYYWRYMGLGRDDVLAYWNTIRCENVLFLRAQCLFIWLITYLVGLSLLFSTEDLFRKDLALLCCGSVFMVLYFLIRDAAKNVDELATQPSAPECT